MRVRAVIAIVVLVGWFNSAPAATVYDSLAGIQYSGGRVLFVEEGQEVTLGGVERAITKFEIRAAVQTTTNIRLRFYLPDGPSGQPSTVLWESAIQAVPKMVRPISSEIIQFEVPNISVPDTFIWALVADDSFNSGIIVLNSDPPSIGDNGVFWAQNYDGISSIVWYPDQPQTYGRGVRITAVAIPEPGVMTLSLTFGIALLGYRRR